MKTMRKATTRLLTSGLAGAFLGAIIIVLGLSMLGAGNREKNNNVPLSSSGSAVVSSSPVVLPISATGSPSSLPSATPEIIPSKEKFSYLIPSGYRLATAIMKSDESITPKDFSVITITKGSAQQEQDYLKIINQLRGDQGATEAPQFLPGQTITLYLASKDAEMGDAKLAHGNEKITTTNGLSGTRYFKVEGLSPADITFLKLKDGRTVAVAMSYGSTEPMFDEIAYLAVVNSIK